ncbi:MAG TPA: hypothetical protein VFV93_12155 [Thermomicrobiales bacterium]|nr:hypothetical protein [Thermomicrobiales bacterium]
MRRLITSLVLALVAILAMASTAVAGGWATVEMDKPVTQIEVNEPMTLDFTLLQHGVTPTDWTTTYVEARNNETGETLRFDAIAGSEVGRWTVDVTFPSAGTWHWAIKTEELAVEDTFPAIEVVDSAGVISSSSGVTPAEMDAAITGATEPLEKQLSSMVGQLDVLEKQVSNLSAERDTLQKQIANLETAQAEQPASSGTSWWVAALAGALAAVVVGGAGLAFAARHGLIRTSELATASA